MSKPDPSRQHHSDRPADNTRQPRDGVAAVRVVAGKATSRRRTPSRKTTARKSTRRRKTAKPFLRRVPLWGILLGIAGAVALYIFVLVHFFVDPGSFRWNAIYGDGVNPDGFEIRGIDISHYQDRINWQKLRNADINGQPLRFVIIKATEGTTLIDENFNENFYQARQNDLVRGAYHFFIPRADARQQARFFLKQVHLEAGDLPPVLDVEKAEPLTPQQLRQAVITWLDMVEKHYGVRPIIYTGYRFKLQYLNDTVFDKYPYWIAHYYVDQLQYKGQWAFWQYTDFGTVDGIEGHVDCNIFNGDARQLHELTIKPEEMERVGL